MKQLQVGIIGVGNMGSSHAKSLYEGKVPQMRLAALCDTAPERKQVVMKQYPSIPFFDTPSELIQSGTVDTIVIATPHYDHPTIAIQALEKGLHVICEKPAGVYTKQVLEMNEAAKKSKGAFGIMYNQRTMPLYQKVRELVQGGQLGALKRIQWTVTNWYRPQAYHNSSLWRSMWATEGGGTLINQNPHQLDLWQWMFGMPSKIMSFVSFGKYYHIETEDDVTAFFQYDNGVTGTYITSTGEAPGTNRLEVAADMGNLVVEKDKITFYRNVESEREFNAKNTASFGRPENWVCDIPVTPGGEQHVGIFKNFASHVLEGTPMLAPGEEGIYGLTISNAIHYSAWTGGWADVAHFPHEEFYQLLQQKIASSTMKKEESKNVVAADMSNTF